jgi:hypothetical protein
MKYGEYPRKDMGKNFKTYITRPIDSIFTTETGDLAKVVINQDCSRCIFNNGIIRCINRADLDWELIGECGSETRTDSLGVHFSKVPIAKVDVYN